MKRISILVVTLLAFATVWGQSKVSPFTAHRMRGQQVQTRTQSVLDEVVSAYLHTVGNPDIAALEALGVKVNLQLDGILTVRLPLSAIPALEQLEFVKYIEAGVPVRQMLDKARPAAGVDKVHAAEGLDMAYTGKGVVVGVIDGGFDYTHPAFRDRDGNLRIKRVWEQCHEGEGYTPPEGFSYGSEFSDPAVILAAGGDVANNSHGTHVTNIAAGSDASIESPYYGIATEADIVLVSNRYASGDTAILQMTDNANISDAIAYIYKYAESVGKPCVINMSLGNHIGPHDGTSTFDRVADQLQGPGRLLVGSVGNNGGKPIHVSKTFSGTDDTALKFFVKKSKNSKGEEYDWDIVAGSRVEIWGDAGISFDLHLSVLGIVGGEYDEKVKTEVLTVGEGEGITKELDLRNGSSCVGSVLVTTEVNPLNGRPHALLTFNVQKTSTNRVIGIIVTPRQASTVHAWAEGFLEFATTEVDGWTKGDDAHSLTEIGGTGKRIISVGAYVSKQTYQVEGENYELELEGETLGALGSFSSFGPTTDGRVKPDIIAPGTFIVSAVNSYDAYNTQYPTASSVVWNGRTYNYSYMQGTSMAAPFVTGVVATWLQAHPTLDSDAIRQVLQKTAINDEYTTLATCGYGKIDAYAGLKEVLALAAEIEGTEADATAASFVVRHVGNALLLSFARPLGQTEVRLYDASGIRLQSHTLDVSEAGHTFTLPMQDLPHGLYLIRVGHETVKVVR